MSRLRKETNFINFRSGTPERRQDTLLENFVYRVKGECILVIIYLYLWFVLCARDSTSVSIYSVSKVRAVI